jgi:hypothetical protein
MVDRIDLCDGVLSMREIMQRYAKVGKVSELLTMTFAYCMLVIFSMVDRMDLCEGVLSMREMVQTQIEGQADKLLMTTFAQRSACYFFYGR